MKTRHIALASTFTLATIAAIAACTGDDPGTTSNAPDGGPSTTKDGSTSNGNDGSVATDSGQTTNDSGGGKTDSGGITDAGVDTGVDAGPLPPTSLGGKLVLWLEAETSYAADGGGTAVWTDKSDMGNNATQATVASQPLFFDGGSGGINGHGVVHFDGTEYLQIPDSTSLQWAAGDFTVYTVVRQAMALPNYAIVYAKWTDAFPYPGYFLWANYPYSATPGSGPATASYVTRLDYNNETYGDASATYNDGKMRVVGTRRAGTSLELHVGGQLVGTNPDASVVDPTGFNAAAIPAYIGGRPGGIQMLQGDIAEMIAVKGTLSDAELVNLENYLAHKYGL